MIDQEVCLVKERQDKKDISHLVIQFVNFQINSLNKTGWVIVKNVKEIKHKFTSGTNKILDTTMLSLSTILF